MHVGHIITLKSERSRMASHHRVVGVPMKSASTEWAQAAGELSRSTRARGYVERKRTPATSFPTAKSRSGSFIKSETSTLAMRRNGFMILQVKPVSTVRKLLASLQVALN